MKNKKSIIIGLLSIVVMYFILFLAIKYVSLIKFSYDLLIICSIVIIFVSLHIFLDIKKLYTFLYKYRYLVGLLLLAFITIMAYNGSSIAFWNRIIQPNTNNYDTVLGIARGIRSDEWLVNTPNALSQVSNGFNTVNNTIMGISSNVTLYPSLPAWNISLLGNILNIPYLIMPFSNAFALMWFGKLFIIFFAWFELFMIITKKNKLYSLLGTIMITFSAANMWWYCTNMNVLAFGPLAVLIFYYFINSKKWINKFLLSVALGIVGLNYIFILYPAWQVTFGYVFLAFFIWLFIENKDKLKIKDLLYIIPTLLIIISVTCYVFYNSIDIFNVVTNTVYPGQRTSTGGYGYNLLFDYFVSLFLPIISYPNPSEASNFLSFYPVPIIMAFYYIIKKKIKDSFLLIFGICAILVSLWNYIKLPTIVAKISLISLSIPERANLVVGLICIIILIRILSLYENKNILNIKKILMFSIISIIIMSLTVYIVYSTFSTYLNIYMIILSIVLFSILLTLILLNNKKTNKYLAVILILLSLVIGGTVNPINKGVSVLTEKPFAKEIQKLVNEDSTSKWISVNCNFGVSDYMIANGASTINSVNYYPNLKLWKKLDPDMKYINIYNRYAHITITLTNEITTFNLVQNDNFNINLNINDIIKLEVNYIVSGEDITIYNNDKINFKLLYNEDGIYIYKIES